MPEAMASTGLNHGALQTEIRGLIRDHLRSARPGYRVITAPGVVPHLRATPNARVPDLAIVCGPRSDAPLLLNPVLPIEILSPSNETETWRNVWAYTTIPSVREILVVRSTRIEAGGTIDLDSIGMTTALDAFYATTALVA